MAAKRGPSIVTDGLVLALDAANPKSYPGSGTTWKNLGTATTTNLTREYATFSSEFQAPEEGEKSQDGVFSCDITFPSSTPNDGLIFETGGSARGHWIGFKNEVLKVRAGDGGINTEVSTTNTAVATTTNYPTDGQVHTLSWDWQINPGRVRIFIDGTLVAEGYTSNNSSIPALAGSNTANYLSNSLNVTSGDPTTAYIPNSASSLRYYNNQQYTTQLESATKKIEVELINGPTFDSGDGGSIVFDGVDDILKIPDDNYLDLSDNITIECWFNPSDYKNTSSYTIPFVQKMSSTSAANFRFYFAGTYRTDRLVILATRGGVWGSVSPTSETIPLNKFTHVVWTYSNGGLLYINGVSQGSITGSGPLSVNDIDLTLGSNLYGKISNFKIYNKALSAEETLQNYNATKSRYGL